VISHNAEEEGSEEVLEEVLEEEVSVALIERTFLENRHLSRSRRSALGLSGSDLF
jgi:hypothetical protein